MHFFQRCCVFFAVTEILIITIFLVSTIRDLIIGGSRIFSQDPLDGYFWKLVFPSAILIVIICLVAAIYLYKGAVNKNEEYLLSWIFVHGIISILASIGCCVALFYHTLPSSLFTSLAILTSILWGRWIIVIKFRNFIKNEALEPQNKLKSNLYYRWEGGVWPAQPPINGRGEVWGPQNYVGPQVHK